MNGISWEMSEALEPTRAITRASPVLKPHCSSSAGMISSQVGPGVMPLSRTIATSTTIEISSCCSWMTVNATGIDARGKCSARISPRLSEIERVPDWMALCENWKTKTPTHSHAM